MTGIPTTTTLFRACVSMLVLVVVACSGVPQPQPPGSPPDGRLPDSVDLDASVTGDGAMGMDDADHDDENQEP